MPVSAKCKGTLLHYFPHFKAHTLPFSVRLQHNPHFVQELFYEDCDHCVEFSDIMLAWQDNNPNLLKTIREHLMNSNNKFVTLFMLFVLTS
jgi:hypothetical protein